MTLPEITLPKIDLPFDIPLLLHPSIDHFAIVLPVIVLLLEFYNLFAQRKSIGLFSSLLLVLTVIAFAAAYFTGVVDGKEAYDLLPTEGQEELKFHKLLGTYLLLASVALLLFKLLAMSGKKIFKVLFFLVLLGFIAVTFQQGKDGGELVYEYGANVKRVKVLDDKLFDTQEALEEAKEEENSQNQPPLQEASQPLESHTEKNVQIANEEQSEPDTTKPKVIENDTLPQEIPSDATQSSSMQKNIKIEDNITEVKSEIRSSSTGSLKMDQRVKEPPLLETTTSENRSAVAIPEVPEIPKVQAKDQLEERVKKIEDITAEMQRLKIETH